MLDRSILDTTKEVEVPEGITLSLPVAGFISRGLAFSLDCLIVTLIIYLFALIFGFLGRFGGGLMNILMFFLFWFYWVLFEIFYRGQTPGKKTLGLVVVNDDGTLIDWSSSIVRNLLRFADFLPGFFVFGILSMLFSRDFKRLGDFAAGTIVIHKIDAKPLIEEEQREGLAPKTLLTLEEQSSILSFSERAHSMSQARVDELANYLQPWLQAGQSQESSKISSAESLLRMAKWIRGHNGNNGIGNSGIGNSSKENSSGHDANGNDTLNGKES